MQHQRGWSFTYGVSSLSFLAGKTWLASFSLQYRTEIKLAYHPQEQNSDLLKGEQVAVMIHGYGEQMMLDAWEHSVGPHPPLRGTVLGC